MNSEFDMVPKCRNYLLVIANNVIFISAAYFTGLGSLTNKHISMRAQCAPEVAEALVDSVLVAEVRANPHNLKEAKALGQPLPPRGVNGLPEDLISPGLISMAFIVCTNDAPVVAYEKGIASGSTQGMENGQSFGSWHSLPARRTSKGMY